MSLRWFALLPAAPEHYYAAAPAHDVHGAPVGHLVAWRTQDGHRPNGSLGIDERALDPDGEPAWVSLALATPPLRVLYDDPAVSQAIRDVLAAPAADVMSTLMLDSSAIGGAITARRDGWSELIDDPFARIFSRRVLCVDAGLIGRMPAPTGPVIQRYSGNPWPWDRFARTNTRKDVS
ncbi:MAG: hypothetical protein JOZ75_09000 [Candidatus Dormibacteraeota bacterium]|nr:hypothetical protein [Candidatus Dormibacteraeota bacterium]